MRRHMPILMIVILMTAVSAAAADTARVITKENAIRQDCKFFAPIKAKVRYNDLLTILAASGDWYKVSYKGVKGCIHKGALAQKSFSLAKLAGGTGGGASGDEVALAGKGFNPQVEASYKKGHPELDFKLVDEIEGYQVAPDTLQEFMQNGGLTLP